jgi:hypothetical protein
VAAVRGGGGAGPRRFPDPASYGLPATWLVIERGAPTGTSTRTFVAPDGAVYRTRKSAQNRANAG